MRWESSGVVGFDLGPLLQGQMRIAKLKSAYNSLIIGPRGFGALSLRWIQFASVLRCARSSYMLHYFVSLHILLCYRFLLMMGRLDIWTYKSSRVHPLDLKEMSRRQNLF